MISIKIFVHVRPAIWMKCIPVRGRNRAKRYFQALLTEFPAVSHRSVKEWANKHPAKAQLAYGRFSMCVLRCGPVRAYPLSYPYLADPDSSITYLSTVVDPVPTRELEVVDPPDL
ncbi:hypothetical protein V6N13_057246 [Hibiscus sabdariffa]|uniref:Uncharacterized protein n=1 Tax=Hibiscus sabdariffa TaxID=183260 RepID=A0ABR2CXN8_9ROSI